MLTELILIILAVSDDPKVDWKELAVSIRNGSHEAFRAFYESQYDALYRFLKSRGLSHDEAEDIIQKAFILVWEHRGTIDENKSLRAYLFQIAYTRMINYVKYQSRFDDADPVENNSRSFDSSHEMDYKELITVIRRILAEMPEKRAQIFELCFLKQFSYKEVADTLDVSVKTVENHMTLAFKDIRQSLTKIYGESLLQKL